MAAFLDTNVLVYAFDRSDAHKRAIAQALLADPTLELVVSAQVLNEFYWTVTRKLSPPLPPDVAHDVVRRLAQNRVIAIDATSVDASIALSREHGLSLWDAGIVTAAQRAGCSELLTEDLSDGQAWGALRVRNPFAT